MSPNEWQTWLARWLRLHPIQDPPAYLQKGYREEVMARIRAERAPARLGAIWSFPRKRESVSLFLKPRLAFGLAGAMAGVLGLALLTRPSLETQIYRLEEELQILAEVAEGDDEAFLPEEDPLEELLLLEEVELA